MPVTEPFKKRNNSNTKDNAPIVPEYNPVSKYQEHGSVPYLTLFDIERKPRETKITTTRTTTCKQSLNSLNTLFHCPVCLGYLKKTFIVMECLHRFCGDCIQKCLRVGKKECPSCRTHIPSRRRLRPDVNYDNVMKKIFGDIEALENSEAREIESWNKKNNMNNAYTERRTLEISKQAKLRKKSARRNLESNAANGATENTDAAQNGSANLRSNSDQTGVNIIRGGIRNLSESNLVDFVLRIHPHEKRVRRLHRECIRTSGDITIEHLKIFLAKKLSYEPFHHFQIITNLFTGKQIVLDDDITLNEIRDEIADRRRDAVMMLQYRRCIV